MTDSTGTSCVHPPTAPKSTLGDSQPCRRPYMSRTRRVYGGIAAETREAHSRPARGLQLVSRQEQLETRKRWNGARPTHLTRLSSCADPSFSSRSCRCRPKSNTTLHPLSLSNMESPRR
ncbi:hypothetical protein EXIGLDRAFT_445661 [Exidia glandulosa HHB12029]|uniref:Uncharacterized protein n=1 Tax=Exidia glandulosa HHB12029 TaxID=1314781 RepID=A0A165B5R1_EXIGL|nr:hypothetical protein EXIGLDRAFT_445661 [Exidia glandulosa HHB12029]